MKVKEPDRFARVATAGLRISLGHHEQGKAAAKELGRDISDPEGGEGK
jgi:hypothetical protein